MSHDFVWSWLTKLIIQIDRSLWRKLPLSSKERAGRIRCIELNDLEGGGEEQRARETGTFTSHVKFMPILTILPTW